MPTNPQRAAHDTACLCIGCRAKSLNNELTILMSGLKRSLSAEELAELQQVTVRCASLVARILEASRKMEKPE